MTDIVIVAATRTAIGKFGGALAKIPAPELGAAVIRELLARAKLQPDQISEVILGQVLAAGSGQNPARQSLIKAGLPAAIPAMTINKVCGSGLKAVMLAAQAVRCGDADIVIAGGQENMSASPHVLPGSRDGFRMGDAKLVDTMIVDGLWDVFNQYHMGTTAENVAKQYGISRAQQDEFSVASQNKAEAAQKAGAFKDEIVGLKIAGKGGETEVTQDESPRKADPTKIPTLKPAFAKDGTVTAANSSSISDGAAALVLTRADVADKRGLKPIARIVAQASHAGEPRWFTTAPVGAIGKVLKLAGWTKDDVDLFEINEAFANVAMIAMRDLGLDHAKVNINGGACALGHPIGASGARIVVTLIHALKTRKLKRGVASLCIGGGEATALAVELV